MSETSMFEMAWFSLRKGFRNRISHIAGFNFRAWVIVKCSHPNFQKIWFCLDAQSFKLNSNDNLKCYFTSWKCEKFWQNVTIFGKWLSKPLFKSLPPETLTNSKLCCLWERRNWKCPFDFNFFQWPTAVYMIVSTKKICEFIQIQSCW